MYLIALTGGIASGKSLVSERFAQLGAHIVDADVIAREIVAPGEPALAELAALFGPGIITEDGALDRAALASVVFGDDKARERLESVTHPRIWRRALERIDEYAGTSQDVVVVYDVPLLAESGTERNGKFDLVVVVHADRETRLRRMQELRGMTRDDAVLRLASQASDAERLAIADVIIDNNATIAETLDQVDALWGRVIR